MLSRAGHPRIRTAIERAARRVIQLTGSPSEEGPAERAPLDTAASDDLSALRRELPVGHLAGDKDRVSRLLADRLDGADIAELERRLAEHPDLHERYLAVGRTDPPGDYALAYGVWLEIASVIEKTGLTPFRPPEQVHAMARGPLSAAGGLYEANIVADALAGVGADVAAMQAGLDFGCSSGRVLRVLHAAYPQIQWHGCDPNGPAIEWATRAQPSIHFFQSANDPPIELPDGSLDCAYAISIWSHFAPALGLRWFAEMHRTIRPGGYLVCTTHGWTSVAHYALNDLRPVDQSLQIRDALYRDGAWYAPEFGEEGDWGVVNSEWGTAFLTPEWMLTHLCPAWRILDFAPGRNQENQDVYVLQRA